MSTEWRKLDDGRAQASVQGELIYDPIKRKITFHFGRGCLLQASGSVKLDCFTMVELDEVLELVACQKCRGVGLAHVQNGRAIRLADCPACGGSGRLRPVSERKAA